MEQKTVQGKGFAKEIIVQTGIVLLMAILLQYVWQNTGNLNEVYELKFPRVLAVSLFLRLWVLRGTFCMQKHQ